MAGEAKTNAFLLSTASVMIGPQSALWNLNETAHGIGLVKNFMIDASPTYTELTQGIKNNIVFSVLTNNPIKATMEVFEFTSKNLAYGLGLDGSALAAISTTDTLNASCSAASVTAVMHTMTDNSAAYPVGAWVALQPAIGNALVHTTKITAAVYDGSGHTLTLTLRDAVPAGVNYVSGDKVSVFNRINVGSKADQPFLSAKIVGIMPDGNQAVVVMIPKLRVVKGFTLAFHSDAFQNLPFEFTPYELVSTDANYADFADLGPAAVFSRQ